jgi:hypothetical protein
MQGDANRQIRRLAEMLPGSAETKFGFNCQCGCGTVVPLTSKNFDANGAWADGHKPDTASDLKAAPRSDARQMRASRSHNA